MNEPFTGYELPSTGGVGTLPCTLTGLAMILAAAILLAKKQKNMRR